MYLRGAWSAADTTTENVESQRNLQSYLSFVQGFKSGVSRVWRQSSVQAIPPSSEELDCAAFQVNLLKVQHEINWSCMPHFLNISMLTMSIAIVLTSVPGTNELALSRSEF